MPVIKAGQQKFDLAKACREHLSALARGKRAYQKAAKLLEQIRAEVEEGQAVQIDAKREAVLVNKLAGKAEVFHGSFFRQYEIEVRVR